MKKETQLLTVANYAKKHKKTTAWAYQQIAKDKVKEVLIDGVKFIEVK